MGILSKMKLTSGQTKGEKTFENLFPGKTFWEVEYDTPAEYVSKYWDAYENSDTPKNNSTNGNIFEIIIGTLFVREGLYPLYLQASVAFIPNVKYDLILYNRESGPIGISLKTSLRERKKQADLEAIALKYVHRKSKSFLISLDEQEVKCTKKSLKEGYLLGLDDVIYAKSDEFNEFITLLKTIPCTEAGSVEIISTKQLVTAETVRQYGTIRK